MLYGDIVLLRLEQTCNLLNVMDIYYDKKIEKAKLSGDQLEELSCFVKKGKLYEALLHYRNQEVDLINMRHNIIISMSPEELRTNLEKYSSYLRELNKEYELFDEPGIKLIL